MKPEDIEAAALMIARDLDSMALRNDKFWLMAASDDPFAKYVAIIHVLTVFNANLVNCVERTLKEAGEPQAAESYANLLRKVHVETFDKERINGR